MRDRLKKLILESDILCHTCGESTDSYCAEYLTDYLIANGVIAPPCKVGDITYHLTSIETFDELNVAAIFEGKVCSISKDEKTLCIFCRYDNGLSFWYTEKDIGEKLFFVREEAEQALKGGAK